MFMTMFDFKEYFEKRIRVLTSEGKKYEGVLSGFENGFDSSSGEDEIELYVGDCCIDIDISSIKSVELIGN